MGGGRRECPAERIPCAIIQGLGRPGFGSGMNCTGWIGANLQDARGEIDTGFARERMC